MKHRPDAALDAGLADLDAVDRVYFCSLPAGTSYAQVVAVALGHKDTVCGAAENGDADGRKRVIAAFVDGTQTGTGTANHYAAVNDAGEEVHAIGELAADVPFTGSGVFPASAITITSRDLT